MKAARAPITEVVAEEMAQHLDGTLTPLSLAEVRGLAPVGDVVAKDLGGLKGHRDNEKKVHPFQQTKATSAHRPLGPQTPF